MKSLGKVVIAAVALGTASCATAPSQAPTVNVTGDWSGEWTCARIADGGGVAMMKLVQNGSQVTGSAHAANPGINRDTSGLTGIVSGNQFTPTNFTSLQGSFTVTGDKMSGDFNGVQCGGKITLTRQPYNQEFTRSRMQTVTATVEAIDYATRTVTLRDSQNNLTTFQVDEKVQNLPLVKVGDEVTVGYYESWALQLDEPANTTSATAVTRAAPGQMPSGSVVRVSNFRATVQAIDPSKPSVTFRGRENRIVEVDVSEDPRILSRLKVGDTYNVSYTQAVAVAVSKAPGR